jgi:alpha-D-xyloside xylohydrolase
MSRPFDLDAFVKDYRHPLHLLQGGQVVIRSERGLTLRCMTTQFERRWRDRYGTLVEIGVPTVDGEEAMLSLEFVTPAVLRLKLRPGSAPLPDNRTPMLDDSFAYQAVDVRFSEDEEALTMSSAALTVRIHHRPWRITIHNTEGFALWETLPAQVYQHPPTGESHLDGASITDAWPWFFRDMFPLGFLRDEQGQTQTFFTATLRHDEHVYGFGEKFSALDKRGQAINLWHANATGNTWPASYKNVPFFMSTRGYGLFLNSAYPIQYHMGDLSHTHYSVHLQHELLDAFFIYGPSMKEVLPRYTALTGRSSVPPLWSFGLWMSRMSYREQTQVEQVADDLRARDIPCDVIHIDTDWFKTPWVNDLTFSPERFPDPAAMIARLREQGFRLTLWQIPYIATESAFYAEGADKGYFARQEDGSPWLIDGFFGKTAVIDYSNAEAVAWMQSKFEPLFAMGVAAIKTDFGEGAPPQARYASVDGLEMHNLYPLLYNRAIYEKTVASTGEGIVWGRSVYAGSQRYPVQWGGDPAALWADLANLWHGGLGLGLCGFPFWSVDIGGFGGTPSPELYIRWAQAGLFVSHPRAHGPIAREPWAFGPEAERIFRRYAKLRYSLMPYVWSEAHHAVSSSTPMLRPLVLDWQDDPTTAHIDDQFCFGRALLVAPIVDEGMRRKVYLPQGQWYDYWTDALMDCMQGGRWLDVQANLEELPLFVRGGSLLATCADAPHTGAQDWGRLTLDIYDGPDFQQTLVDKDGTLTEVSYAQGQISVQGGAPRHYIVRLHSPQGLRSAQVSTTDASPVVLTL